MIFEDFFAQTDKLTTDNFKNVFDALEMYNEYITLVKYFEGGTVELFRIDDFDFDIISVSRV